MNIVHKEILEIVRELPGVTRPEIRELMPHVSEATFAWAMTELTGKGHFQIGSRQRPAGAKGKRTLNTYTLQPTPSPRNQKMTTENVVRGLVDKVDELQAKIADLTAWRALALERHPDLAVAPVVLEAREIVASFSDEKMAADVRAGRKDNCPIMLATVEALTRRAA